MPPGINTSYNESCPSLTTDGCTLYFVRDNPDSPNRDYDCKQIFMAYKNKAGMWSKPEPLPVNIDCEHTPKICPDNKTLLFSSLREGGPGGFDVYYTKMMAPGNWTKPQPVNSLNSAQNDLSPSVSAVSNTLYFSRSEKEKRNPDEAVFKASLPEKFSPEPILSIHGVITDVANQEPIQANIQVIDAINFETVSETENNSFNGNYFISLPKGKLYVVKIQKQDFTNVELMLNTKHLQACKLTQKNIQLSSSVALRLNILDSELFEPINAGITVIDATNNIELENNAKQIVNGQYTINVDLGRKYAIIIKAPFYKNDTVYYDFRNKVLFNSFENTLHLNPLKRNFQISVTQLNTKDKLPAKITFRNQNRNEIISLRNSTSENKSTSAKLRQNNSYQIEVNPPVGFTYFYAEIDNQTDNLDVNLAPLNVGIEIKLTGVEFEKNSADLKVHSYSELDRLLKLLVNNPKLKGSISVYTDDNESEDFNRRLYNKRVETITSYFINQNVESSRLLHTEFVPPVEGVTSEQNKNVVFRITGL